jgi:hypothetical protein
VQGAALLRRRGLHRPSDLLDFDFVSYWQRWLRLYHRDYARLGRFDANRYGNRKRQHAVKRDTRRGAVLYSSCRLPTASRRALSRAHCSSSSATTVMVGVVRT